MKKALCILCALAILVSFCACGTMEQIAHLIKPSAEPTATAEPTAEPTAKPSAKPTAEPDPTDEPKPTKPPKTTSTPEIVVTDDRPLVEKLCGTYVINPQSEEETTLDIYLVDGKLMAEFADMYSYWAEELYPLSDDDLYEVGTDEITLIALPYDGNSFTGCYWSLSYVREIEIRENGISTTVEGRPTAFYERTDPYDDVSYLREYFEDAEIGEAPLGKWRGQYVDSDYNYHTLYLELNKDGTMYFLDRDEIGIPHILHGVYVSDRLSDGSYDLGYIMVERGNYKMPHTGSFVLEPDGGWLYFTDPDSDYAATRLDGGTAALMPCTEGRADADPYVLLVDDDVVYADVDGDGCDEEIEVVVSTDDNDDIAAITVYVDGYGASVNITAWYADVYLMYTGFAGLNYIYADCWLDNDYRDILIYSLDSDGARFAGEYFGGFYEEPEDPYGFLLSTTVQMLSTSTGVKPYRVGRFGMPEALDTTYYAVYGATLTIKRDYETWAVDPETDSLIDYVTIPAGTELTQYYTDNKDYYDLYDGNLCYRFWVDTSNGWPQTVEGTDIDELFDGLMFAG